MRFMPNIYMQVCVSVFACVCVCMGVCACVYACVCVFVCVKSCFTPPGTVCMCDHCITIVMDNPSHTHH